MEHLDYTLHDIVYEQKTYDNALQLIPEKVMNRLNMLSTDIKKWEGSYLNMDVQVREDYQMYFTSTFKEFWHFAIIGMRYLGFDTTWMQIDMAHHMQYGDARTLIMAQRGEAKTTLAALYSTWTLMQNPRARVLIISAGEKQAHDICRLIVRLIDNWGILCWLRGDPRAKDRSSTESYDVHYSLRGIDKSASVESASINAQLQGRRADLLIPDDLETQQNGMTATEREKIKLLSKEFSAIVANELGRIMYLGTPQTEDSIYKELPNRGFTTRIWYGRHPNKEQFERYKPEQIAPTLLYQLEKHPELMLGGYGIDGTLGMRTDPKRYSEEELLQKELDYQLAGFTLQFMLDTSLSDAARTKLKLSDLIVGDYDFETVPESLHYAAEPRFEIPVHAKPQWYSLHKMYRAAGISEVFVPFKDSVLKVDPAGSGGDEVGFAGLAATNGYIHLLVTGGLKGGLTNENIDYLVDLTQEMGISRISIEKNMGHGTATMVFMQRLRERNIQMPVTDYHVTGQKEKRIIDALYPIMKKHKLVVHQRALDMDKHFSMKHPLERQAFSSLFYQIANITTDRGSLVMDDRIDGLASGVIELAPQLVVDERKAEEQRAEAERKEFMSNPMGYAPEKIRSRSRNRRDYGR